VWAVLALHPEGLPALRPKIRPRGMLLVNAGIGGQAPEWPDVHRVLVPATDIAKGLGQPMGATMVTLGAFAAATGLVEAASLAAAMRDVLPPHRRHLADGNARCLDAGAAFVRDAEGPGDEVRAWG
jgi:2-oxoglutarate ferredoxin oxidoreductase subunit gamma